MNRRPEINPSQGSSKRERICAGEQMNGADVFLQTPLSRSLMQDNRWFRAAPPPPSLTNHACVAQFKEKKNVHATNRAAHYISILGTSNGAFYHRAFIIIFPLLCQAAANQRKRSERRRVEEERADHVFPLLTSALWHVHTWFSLECCFSGIAVGTSGWQLQPGTGRSVHAVSQGRRAFFLFFCTRVEKATSGLVSKFKPDEIRFTSRQQGQRCERKMLHIPQQLLLLPPKHQTIHC